MITNAMKEITNGTGRYQTVDLERRLLRESSPAIAAVNGYAQATIIRAAAQNRSLQRERLASPV